MCGSISATSPRTPTSPSSFYRPIAGNYDPGVGISPSGDDQN
jgi:hypothetical protein